MFSNNSIADGQGKFLPNERTTFTDRVMTGEVRREIPAPGYYGNPQSDFEPAAPQRTIRPGQSIDSEVDENPKKLPAHPDFNKAVKFCCFIDEAVRQS